MILKFCFHNISLRIAGLNFIPGMDIHPRVTVQALVCFLIRDVLSVDFIRIQQLCTIGNQDSDLADRGEKQVIIIAV
jgi:hypothetical protein